MKNFHARFKQWLVSNHSAIDEEEWVDIIALDETHPYDQYPVSDPPQHTGPSQETDEVCDVATEDVPEPNPNMYHFEA